MELVACFIVQLVKRSGILKGAIAPAERKRKRGRVVKIITRLDPNLSPLPWRHLLFLLGFTNLTLGKSSGI